MLVAIQLVAIWAMALGLSLFVFAWSSDGRYMRQQTEKRTGLLTGRPSKVLEMGEEDELEVAFRQLEKERWEWFEPHSLAERERAPEWRWQRDGRFTHDVTGSDAMLFKKRPES